MAPPSIILWTGPKHSGKTTRAARLVQAARERGFGVAGCLAPSVYANDTLLGFDIVNLHNDERTPLARRGTGQNQGFRFTPEGLTLGNEALGPIATRDADLVIIDEYGPLELAFRGWRAAVDRLMTSADALLLLVVREELTDRVLPLYGGVPAQVLVATQREALDKVLAVLENNRP